MQTGLLSITNYNPKFTTQPVNCRYSPAFTGRTAAAVKAADELICHCDKESAMKLTGVFDRKQTQSPKGLNLIFSQANNSLLSYSKEFGDNVVLRAIKKTATDKNKTLFYVLFKEFKNGELKNTFALDIESGELIRLKADGTASVYQGSFVPYQKGDPKGEKYCRKVIEYACKIFGLPEGKSEEEIIALLQAAKRPKSPQPLTDLSHCDSLPEDLQKSIADINGMLMDYSDYIDANRGHSSAIVDMKSKYEPLIYTTKKQKNLTFKYKNLESLAVLHSRSNQRFTRIIHTNSNGIEKHLLIDRGQCVVANLNNKRPWLIPEKYRYMTKREIEESEIGVYIEFLKNQIQMYYDYIQKGVENIRGTRHYKPPKKLVDINKFMDESLEKISGNLLAMQGEIEQRADKDAEAYVSMYFNALAESFEKYSQKGLKEFEKKFRSYLDKLNNKTTAQKES